MIQSKDESADTHGFVGPAVTHPQWRDRLPLMVSFALALTCHAGLAAAFLLMTTPGWNSGVTEIEAITVSLMDEPPKGTAGAIENVLVAPAARRAARDEPREKASHDPGAALGSTGDKAVEPERLTHRDLPPLPRERGDDAHPAAARPAQDAEIEQRRGGEAAPAPEFPSQAADRVADREIRAALANVPGEMAAQPAAASSKAISAFTRLVVKALAEARPSARDRRGRRHKGTARIRFVVALDGGIREVALSASSGDDDLDSLALKAVHKARIPRPPEGMTIKQLTYEVPFHFR